MGKWQQLGLLVAGEGSKDGVRQAGSPGGLGEQLNPVGSASKLRQCAAC